MNPSVIVIIVVIVIFLFCRILLFVFAYVNVCAWYAVNKDSLLTYCVLKSKPLHVESCNPARGFGHFFLPDVPRTFFTSNNPPDIHPDGS